MDSNKHRKKNHIMTPERESYIRSLPVVTIKDIKDYMNCSEFVAKIYIEELKLKTDVITDSNRNTPTRNFRRKVDPKKPN